MRVLLAEDHKIVRQGTRLYLESEGIEVIGEAVQRARELQPDVVIMDIHLPELTGIEATRRIRHENDAVHILALTAYDEPTYIHALLDAGADGFILKTAELPELLRALREVAQGRKAFDEAALAKAAQHSSLSAQIEGLTDREIAMLRRAMVGMVGHVRRAQEQSRAYADQLSIGQENERKRIARELHDETIQGLIAVTQSIDLTKNWLQSDPARAGSMLMLAREQAVTTVNALRDLIGALRQHYGLLGIQERVGYLGGSIHISSRIGQGTTVEVCIPTVKRIEPSQWVRDPVCSALLEPEQVYGSILYEGERYHFCCPVCQGAFQKDPALYLAANGQLALSV